MLLSSDISKAGLCEIGHTARIKQYPGGSWELMAASEAIWRDAGWEARERCVRGGGRSPEAAEAAGGDSRSQRRARSALRDKALCTPMRYFVTLTLSPQLVADRHDIGALVKLLRVWLDNRVRRKGLAYVLVPERHKDGALHLHGLITGGVDLRDSGTIKPAAGGKPRRPRSQRQREAWLADGGQIVYNVVDWPYGFSTALELRGDYDAAVGYVCKYIGKDSEKIGGRWYFSGGALGAPVVTYCDVSFTEAAAAVGAYTTEISCGERYGFALAIVRGKGAIRLERRRDDQ